MKVFRSTNVLGKQSNLYLASYDDEGRVVLTSSINEAKYFDYTNAGLAKEYAEIIGGVILGDEGIVVDHIQEYQVVITETRKRVVSVFADSEEVAIDLVANDYEDERFVLNDQDYIDDYTIRIKGKETQQ
ncbi:MAG: DpnD/PcfM-like protein [Sedimentibacter sp.]|nr:DpnD/PcfM-like protein [Sedimentibacter sp.]